MWGRQLAMISKAASYNYEKHTHTCAFRFAFLKSVRVRYWEISTLIISLVWEFRIEKKRREKRS